MYRFIVISIEGDDVCDYEYTNKLIDYLNRSYNGAGSILIQNCIFPFVFMFNNQDASIVECAKIIESYIDAIGYIKNEIYCLKFKRRSLNYISKQLELLLEHFPIHLCCNSINEFKV